jgi:hypothetical protein
MGEEWGVCDHDILFSHERGISYGSSGGVCYFCLVGKFCGWIYRSCTCARRNHYGTASTADGIRETEKYRMMKK